MNEKLVTIILMFSVLIVSALSVSLAIRIKEFKTELKYLNVEIDRTGGIERQYWIKRKRRLWLSLLPFVKY